GLVTPDDFLELRDHRPRGRVEHHIARSAIEQPATQFFFERAHLQADRRRRQADMLSRPGERAVPDNGKKGFHDADRRHDHRLLQGEGFSFSLSHDENYSLSNNTSSTYTFLARSGMCLRHAACKPRNRTPPQAARSRPHRTPAPKDSAIAVKNN